MRCIAVCCSVLQCVAPCVAVCCSVLQTLLQCVAHCVAVCCIVLSHELLQEVSMQYVAVCCSVLQCVVVLQCVAVCCSVLHCVAVCCTVLHCVLTRAASGSGYAVATVGRLDKIISLFCRILSLLQGSFATETDMLSILLSEATPYPTGRSSLQSLERWGAGVEYHFQEI